MNFIHAPLQDCYRESGCVSWLSDVGDLHLAWTLPGDVADAPALVTGLGAGIRTVLHDVTYLITIVTRVLVLTAVPGDVSGAMALVTPVLLLSALSSKVSESIALVAL